MLFSKLDVNQEGAIDINELKSAIEFGLEDFDIDDLCNSHSYKNSADSQEIPEMLRS
jgi:Ca2+-binding EF-hand superfamily protein